jgi:hypothetical protein
MSKIIQGVSVRDHYPDYPKDLKDWELWQIMENHEIGIRTALTEDKAMDSKWQIRSWHKTTLGIMEKHGHNNLAYKQCSCYRDWMKAKGRTF